MKRDGVYGLKEWFGGSVCRLYGRVYGKYTVEYVRVKEHKCLQFAQMFRKN